MPNQTTLEETLVELAARGEISHLSVSPSQDGKLWRASFAMCSKFGVSYAEDASPAKAMLLAMTTAKMKRYVPPRGSLKPTADDDVTEAEIVPSTPAPSTAPDEYDPTL